jgi:hypothetical protein
MRWVVCLFETHYNRISLQNTAVSTCNYRREFGQYHGVVLVNHYKSILLSCSGDFFVWNGLLRSRMLQATCTFYLGITCGSHSSTEWSLNSITRLVLQVDKKCIYCEVGPEFFTLFRFGGNSADLEILRSVRKQWFLRTKKLICKRYSETEWTIGQGTHNSYLGFYCNLPPSNSYFFFRIPV